MTGNVPTYWISKSGRIDKSSSAFLMQLKKQNRSPNTVKRYAWSVCYMLNYLYECRLELNMLSEKEYGEQVDIFRGFLLWIKSGKHKNKVHEKTIKNKTCNDRLRDFIQYYEYLVQFEAYTELQVLRKRVVGYLDHIGISKKNVITVFDFYLDEKEDKEYKAHIVTDEELEKIFSSLKNLRDIALLRLLSDTGLRIGETLGIHQEDLYLKQKYVLIQFRSTNENGARAKRGEFRKVYFSKETQQAITEYIKEYEMLLQKTDALFITLQGARKGKAMRKSDVDSLMRRLEEKTGIHLYAHLFRHRFADKRDENKDWDLLSISKALGHKHIGTTEKYLNAAVVKCEEKQKNFFEEKDAVIDIEWLLE